MRFLGWLMILLVPLLWAGGLTGCRNDDSSKRGGDPSPKEGKLYVANAGDGSLLAFDQAIFVEGNISPSRRFPESITGPTGIFLDRSTDTLYVANTDHHSILIYEGAGTLNFSVGSADATRVISGPKTGLNRPVGVVYDAGRDRLYVANQGNPDISTDDSILVFQKDCPQPNLLNANIAPCRILSGAATQINLPQALAVDTQRDILYIADSGNHSILAYENASQAAVQGDLPPTRAIRPHGDPSRPESLLNRPSGLFIDGDRLYVVNAGGSPPAIFVYENAAGRSGETIPERVLAGQNTQLSNPAGIDLSIEQDRLYLLDNNSNGTAVLIFDNFSSRCAASSCDPSRVITGPKTGLANGTGIAYDPARDTTYIANTSAGDILIFALDGNLAPLKINTGAFQTTGLLQPTGFFYDQSRDRLYIANFNAATAGSPPIIVYENVSTKSFPTATRYDWAIQGIDIQRPRSVYVTQQYLIVLNTPVDKVLIYDLAPLSNPPSNGGIITLQNSNLIGTLSGVDPLGNAVGFIRGTAMAVDEAGGGSLCRRRL